MSISPLFNEIELTQHLHAGIRAADLAYVRNMFDLVKKHEINPAQLVDVSWDTPLMLAAFEHGEAIPHRREKERANALFEIAKLCLKSEIPVDSTDYEGRTAFMIASGSSDFSLMDLLAQHGADINHQSDLGETALMEAARGSYYDPHGEDFDLRGQTALKLLDMRADPRLTNAERLTAAQIATASGCEEMAVRITGFAAATDAATLLIQRSSRDFSSGLTRHAKRPGSP